MIPHKLQLKNFLSYGSELQTIDFSPYQLICLSGKNGHGKSALLDAITWALWGQARKVSGMAKADQGLLRLGQTQMLVVFDFEFNNQMYRIRREYMQTYGKPYATLEFGILDSDTGILIPLTDKTIRTTQAKIDQTLHLDFNSFSNSAFLRQGNANEFSKKSPRDRKQILASILQLDQYETIRKLAMDKYKQGQIKKHILITLQEKREQELHRIPELQKQITSIETQYKGIEKQEQYLTQEQHNLASAHKKIIEEQKQQDLLNFKLQQFTQEKEKQEQTLRNTFSQWRTIHKKQRLLGDLNKIETRKKQLLTDITEYQQLFQKNLDTKEQLLKRKEHIQQLTQQYNEQEAAQKQKHHLKHQKLIAEKQHNEHFIQKLEKQIKESTLEHEKITDELKIIQAKKPVLDSNQLTQQEEKFEKYKTAYHHFVAHGNWYKNEQQSLEQKQKLTHDDNDPSCPLCEQNLSASRKRFLKIKFTKHKQFLQNRLKRLTNIIPKLKEILITQHRHITKAKEAFEQENIRQLKITELQKNTDKIQLHTTTLTKELDAHQKTITILDNQINKHEKELTLQKNKSEKLETNKQFKELQQQTQNLERDIKKNAYNPNTHKDTQEKLNIIEQQLAERTTIYKEIARQQERKDAINLICKVLKKLKSLIKDIITQLKTFHVLSQKIKDLQKNEQLLEKKREQLEEERVSVLQQKGSLETLKKQLENIKKEHIQEKKNIAMLDSSIDDYQVISTATSKDGIQALLIEDAIPEIEQEANQLLGKLTNNQSQVFIESLRDLKKGGTKETLDIKISDTAGIRPYELFSGGEAFRIDFALRIAISKLLARRAGTALQTLIIDEGFGSQDEEGLTYIMDAIYKIQDDFSKIIIVSHLSAMKDQFPVHFMVEKGPQGSHVRVIEQG